MSGMSNVGVSPAPRWRSTLAGVTDAAILGGAAWLWRRRAGDAALGRRSRRVSLLGPLAELVREQLGSPGQRVLGLRTVDRRTGRRPELWRTFVVLGAALGGQLLVRRLTPPVMTPQQERQREDFMEELRAIHERHPDDASAREAERRRLFERHPGPIKVNLWRTAAPAIAIALLKNRLRRRLTPTLVVVRSPTR
jgi:hypothetical protein